MGMNTLALEARWDIPCSDLGAFSSDGYNMSDFRVSALWCTPMRRGVVHDELTEPLPSLSRLEWCEINRLRLSSGLFLSLSTWNHQRTRANSYGQDGNGPAELENPFSTSDMYCVRHCRASSGSKRFVFVEH